MEVSVVLNFITKILGLDKKDRELESKELELSNVKGLLFENLSKQEKKAEQLRRKTDTMITERSRHLDKLARQFIFNPKLSKGKQ